MLPLLEYSRSCFWGKKLSSLAIEYPVWVITLAALTVPTASRITVVCLPAVNVNGISAADLIVEALGQLSVSAAIESVLGGRFHGNDSGTLSSAGTESVAIGLGK
ncbi:hypothetical protein EUGRSUZ_B01961 [Eucalyptus grandis]|uniref:Uncharacterized protein n=2 Tax=Eucalyptus grandis TaxID=71139 RepID=A0ACC3LRX0_EUCGR|nr:hypothetical protein EUGRSUZ_B01961 [Eucalyptus grandis]